MDRLGESTPSTHTVGAPEAPGVLQTAARDSTARPSERNRHWCTFKRVVPSRAINARDLYYTAGVQRQYVRSAIFSQCDFFHQ